jgi:ribosomal protein S18 acetylase RimI-like enzyme
MIREFQAGDHVAIAEIFVRAVHEIASRDYSVEQCLAWSDTEPNPEHWRGRCEVKRPFVYVDDASGEIAGFLELEEDGHIDCAYIHPKFQRRGLMSRLVTYAVQRCAERGLQRVYVEASLCAKPMFEKLGFRTVSERAASVKGVALINFQMERKLPDNAGGRSSGEAS